MFKGSVLKEMIWLLIIASLTILYKEVVPPIISGNTALDINQHSTYYIFAPHNSLWILIPGMCFIVYIIRAILSRVSNSFMLIILAVSCLFVLGWLENKAQVAYALTHYNEMNKLFTLEFKQKQGPSGGLFYGGDNRLISIYYHHNIFVLMMLQVILVLFIGFIGFKIGKNSKRLPVNN